jgi:hypothetical protein
MARMVDALDDRKIAINVRQYNQNLQRLNCVPRSERWQMWISIRYKYLLAMAPRRSPCIKPRRRWMQALSPREPLYTTAIAIAVLYPTCC